MTTTKSPLKVTYRAVFKSPLMGPLNPTGVPFAVSMTLEVYQAKESEWKVRELDTGKKRVLVLPSAPSHEAMQSAVRGLFREQVTGWRMYGDLVNKIDGDLLLHGKEYGKDGMRPIASDEIEVRNGKVYLRQAEKTA